MSFSFLEELQAELRAKLGLLEKEESKPEVVSNTLLDPNTIIKESLRHLENKLV